MQPAKNQLPLGSLSPGSGMPEATTPLPTKGNGDIRTSEGASQPQGIMMGAAHSTGLDPASNTKVVPGHTIASNVKPPAPDTKPQMLPHGVFGRSFSRPGFGQDPAKSNAPGSYSIPPRPGYGGDMKASAPRLGPGGNNFMGGPHGGPDRNRFAGPPSNGAPPSNGPQRPHGEERRGPPLISGHPTAPGQRPTQPAGPSGQQAFRGPPAGAPPNRAPGPPNGPPHPGPTGGMKELRVEDALVYLDDVKREFGDQPRIYNEFLEIMKNFKSQEVDTPGVINRVSKLFRGYNNLILGFNKFLPDGYKISLQDLERKDAEYARQQQLQQQNQPSQPQAGGYHRPPFPPGSAPPNHVMSEEAVPPSTQSTSSTLMPAQSFSKRPPQIQRRAQIIHRPGPKQGPNSVQPVVPQPVQGMPPQQLHLRGPGPTVTRPSQPPPQPQPQHQAVEFDHAISYVTNIKKRFADDPNTYHQFLEILHTYQKEQRGIKEVLEQVASLFADHPDLLKEFTFFLPDAVQEQAKERLHRAAAESESRQALAAQKKLEQQQETFANRPNWGGPRGLDNRQAPPGRRNASQKFIDMTGVQQLEKSPVVSEEVQSQRQVPRKRPFSPGREPALAPETYVYNSAVERQFFEAAKEALISYSRDGGQAWAEFLKCLDMYAQELLSKNEMLSFVEPLLGKRNVELFEEFKRILSAAGTLTGQTPSMEDSWYSVPLSEIDFFRCRQCTPSYRALPRDYPAPPCSERSAEEKKILNNVWVSLPKGSEESYTFRHMRRNHCEEVLFRCEDERFEIDMVIDSNAATLRRLQPIAEEIGQLAQEEPLVSELSNAGMKTHDEGGMGGLRYQYTFDPTILGVIHRNSIARIYGDAGQEMLDLIVKNPSVAVPIVVERLRQKDSEWKNARERLNRHWKELAEMNYYKSLDHRSLTWRTIDKRATSTRTLVSEIKDRAANGGKEGEAAMTARREKAKEEHGSFYEITMGDFAAQDLDLTNRPKPHAALFTPHMSLLYENNSWVQRDAYRVLSFALERGSISPADKERCHALWRDLLGPIFGIPISWMQKPALSYLEDTSIQTDAEPVVVSNGEENSHDDDFDESDDEHLGNNVVTEELRNQRQIDDKSILMDHHPLPAGTVASTVYGEGRIVRFRSAEKFYEVELPFGTGYLRPNTVLCTVERVEESPYTNQLREQDKTTLEREEDFLCFGTQSLYLFFRLHQILIRRLNIAKQMAYEVVKDESLQALVEQMKAEPNEDIGRKRYEAYLSLVYSLVDGGHNDAGGKYEDRVRCLLGHGAYELATMDKLLSHILKNLQSIAHDDVMLNLVTLFRRHCEAGFRPDAFKQEAAYLSEGDLMYAFQLCTVPDADTKVIYMEHLGVIYEEDDNSQVVVESEPEPIAKRPRFRV